MPVTTTYKVLSKTAEGKLVSAFEEFEYKVGKWRSEAAKPDNGGEFCCYLDEARAIDPTKRGPPFAASVATRTELVLCTVEIKGREIEYDDGDWAASKLRAVEELRPATVD